mmetsp:Transcript_4990/g.12923  ORF Transcript_4990/g.12923 Transcript_4990/m.12923 type:complete len:236 (-) Transcript_4990:545-1252(-)
MICAHSSSCLWRTSILAVSCTGAADPDNAAASSSAKTPFTSSILRRRLSSMPSRAMPYGNANWSCGSTLAAVASAAAAATSGDARSDEMNGAAAVVLASATAWLVAGSAGAPPPWLFNTVTSSRSSDASDSLSSLFSRTRSLSLPSYCATICVWSSLSALLRLPHVPREPSGRDSEFRSRIPSFFSLFLSDTSFCSRSLSFWHSFSCLRAVWSYCVASRAVSTFSSRSSSLVLAN